MLTLAQAMDEYATLAAVNDVHKNKKEKPHDYSYLFQVHP